MALVSAVASGMVDLRTQINQEDSQMRCRVFSRLGCLAVREAWGVELGESAESLARALRYWPIWVGGCVLGVARCPLSCCAGS